MAELLESTYEQAIEVQVRASERMAQSGRSSPQRWRSPASNRRRPPKNPSAEAPARRTQPESEPLTFVTRPAAGPLALAGAALLLEAAPAGGLGRPGGRGGGAGPQGGGELLRQALQGQFAVAGLAAPVLGDGGDERAERAPAAAPAAPRRASARPPRRRPLRPARR